MVASSIVGASHDDDHDSTMDDVNNYFKQPPAQRLAFLQDMVKVDPSSLLKLLEALALKQNPFHKEKLFLSIDHLASKMEKEDQLNVDLFLLSLEFYDYEAFSVDEGVLVQGMS